MLQNFKEQLSNEDTIEEISQDEFLIPKPSGSEDFHEDNAVEMEEIKYFIVENGSRKKNNMITDSCGYSYSYWRKSKKTKHFRCIKRHTKGKSDCPSILKVTNCNEENQEVIRTNEHNHEPDLALNIRRQINIDLKKECMEKNSERPSKVIHNVLESNVQYKNLYDKGSSLPKMSSMKMTINRHRNFMSSVNLTFV